MKFRLASVSSCLAAAFLTACAGQEPSAVRAQPVTKGPISEVVSATGEVGALVTVNVGSQVSGTISRLHVDFNSVVKKGQALAELDPRLFEAALGKAEAGAAAARADELGAAGVHVSLTHSKGMAGAVAVIL
jgi:multidrug efflux pump subunit AcrA (membrane-fusion protein)